MKSKICGIYCIENVLDHKKYIGQSVDIYARWSSHLSELRYNKHKNSYFQRSWNKYGKENFKFYVLEICPKSQLDNREKDGILNIINHMKENMDIIGIWVDNL